MAITGQISLARAGETVQVFQNISDLNDIFDSNSTPSLQDFDHITLYPGDFTDIGDIEIPEDPEVYLTILPGASVSYNFALQKIDRAKRLQDRYENFSGAVENIADLNIAHLYETSVEKQLSRVRRYIDSTDETPEPYVEYNNLDDAAEDASSGETIVVFPGAYNPENNLLVDGVDWKFLSGAKVIFDPVDPFEQYPYALFDDSKTPDGASKGSEANCSVFGDGKFVIGRSFENSAEEGTANADWDGWNKYCLLALSKNQSDVKFEADTIRLEKNIDAAIKYAKSSNLNVDVETLEFGPQNKVSSEIKNNTFSDLTDVPLPAFMVVNGHIGEEPEAQKIDINVEEVVIEEPDEGPRESFPYLLSGVNPNQNNGFSGEVYLSFEKQRGLTNTKTAVSFPENASHGPQKILIENSNLNGSVELAGSSFQKTHLIVKETEIQDENNAPILLSGNGNNIGVSLSKAWLLSENAQYSIKNETEGTNNFTVKAYNNSFADLPIENFKEVLHDELNNVAWSEDVGSIR